MCCEAESLNELLPVARHLAKGPSRRRSLPQGYDIKEGEKVLMAVNNHYDEMVVKALVTGIREKGASVDVITFDSGPDRELTEVDEIASRIRRKHWTDKAAEEDIKGVGFGSGYGRLVWVEQLAHEKYDILIYGIGGPGGKIRSRYEGVPWFSRDAFACGGPTFPVEIIDAVEAKTWDMIWNKGPGGKVRLTDPEGTDLTYTLWEDYFTGTWRQFTSKPYTGHLMGHPTLPLIEKEDACGVIAGTTNHASCPFPHIKVHLENTKIARIEGGGKYGDGWRDLMNETKRLKYPDFPGEGLFWLWEVAIGTNPKYIRPKNAFTLAVGGTMIERRRSGVIHCGLGTGHQSAGQDWAGKQGLPYGHLHVHLLFPTYEITTKTGEKFTVIKDGRITALDDPEVRKIAAKYGDPDVLLKEDWIPPMPGISVKGDYWEEYAKDPFSYVKAHG